ncbi:unnamed protein product, partial [Meganyctiphanes norvegica]
MSCIILGHILGYNHKAQHTMHRDCANVIFHNYQSYPLTRIGGQTIKWRKTRWDPKAPSKIFRVTQRKKLPEDELREMTRLNNNYNTYMRAIRRHLHDSYLLTSATSEFALKEQEEIEAEHDRMMEYNRQENERVAKLREERIRNEHEADMERVKLSIVKKEEEKLIAKEEALKLIRDTQEIVKTFIRREDLQTAIESAIANPVDYNFAMDADGHIFRGRNTRPADVPEDEREKLEVTSG